MRAICILNIEEDERASQHYHDIRPGCFRENWELEKTPEGVGVLTTPQEAKQFVDATKIDVLVPAVGNMHRLLQSMVHGETQKRLDIQRIG